MENPQLNLCPVKLSIAGDRIVCAVSIRHADRWKKFQIACDTAKELWDTVQSINAKGAQALADATLQKDCATSDTIAVEYDYIAEATKRFLQSGKTIKHCAAGDSAFATSAIDLDSLVAELDKIPDTVAAELESTVDEDFDNVPVAARA